MSIEKVYSEIFITNESMKSDLKFAAGSIAIVGGAAAAEVYTTSVLASISGGLAIAGGLASTVYYSLKFLGQTNEQNARIAAVSAHETSRPISHERSRGLYISTNNPTAPKSRRT